VNVPLDGKHLLARNNIQYAIAKSAYELTSLLEDLSPDTSELGVLVVAVDLDRVVSQDHISRVNVIASSGKRPIQLCRYTPSGWETVTPWELDIRVTRKLGTE
jgi:hypothetical protein